MYKLLVLLGLLFSTSFLQAQNYWTPKNHHAIADKKISPERTPRIFSVYELNLIAFKKSLLDAPLRGNDDDSNRVEVSFPMADGTFQVFQVIETPVFDEALSARFPTIKSYAGQGVENPAEMIRFSVSPKGVHNMLLSSNGSEFMEPFSEDLTHYMVYKRKHRATPKTGFECSVTDAANNIISNEPQLRNNADDGILRTFRLAVSTNEQYTTYHGGTVADALAAINITMTRVNAIYETDFNVTMTLINATTDVIFTSANDPYTANSGNQLQTQLSNIIGEANYDIGHLFSGNGSNGNAGCIGCVCVNGSKGSAFTAQNIPEGDVFDIDYVAHEMGHQFGGNHTWTHAGSEGTIAQVEPGSGSTIMGYAGITGNTDVQDNSDFYFHAVSIEQITDYIKSTNCQTETNTGNAVPVVNAGPNFTIPGGTPFILEGSATDADAADVLTYCWEQMDDNNSATTFPSTTATSGVAFRSLSPTTSPDRYMPELNTVRGGSTGTTWEVVPEVDRDMNFRLTVRDNRLGGGTNESDNMVVTTDGESGPFVVTVPNGGEVFCPSSSYTITWNVANSDQAPVNATSVDIFLSTDSGLTYPTVLATAVPNTGSASITMPAIASTTARIMVRGSGNIFYDISNGDFTIQNTTADFSVLTSPNSFYTCQAEDAVFTINLNNSCGFSENVSLSASGLPAGAVATFGPTSIANTATSTLTISNIAAVAAGTYTVNIEGTGSTGTRTATVDLTIDAACPTCTSTPSTDTPIDIVNGTAIFTSTINIPTGGTIDDVIVSGVDISHDWVGDLVLTLEHNGTTVLLLDNPGQPASQWGCGEDDILVNFDDDAAINTTAEAICDASSIPTINGTFLPEEVLSAFDGMDMAGDWTLTVEDTYPQGDPGVLNTWNLDICIDDPTSCVATMAIPDVPIATGSYQSSVLISSTGTVNSGDQVIFDAGNCIELNANFEVILGAEFEAIIGGCQ